MKAPSQLHMSSNPSHGQTRHCLPSAPLLPSGGSPASVGREAGTDSLCRYSFFLLDFVSSDIDKVVVMVTLWNKVSLTYPYFNDVRSGADEGPMRVGSTRSVGYIQIFAIGESVMRCN